MREILQEEVVHNCRGGFPCTWGGLLWFMWSASEVEDGAWLLFTWGQGEEGRLTDESVVFVVCVGYRGLVHFLPVWQRAASRVSCAGLPLLAVLPAYTLEGDCVGHQRGAGKY